MSSYFHFIKLKLFVIVLLIPIRFEGFAKQQVDTRILKWTACSTLEKQNERNKIIKDKSIW